MRTIWFVSSLLALALLTSVPLVAQQGTAQIAGKITDEQGAVLPGVAVVVTNEATGVFRDTTTSGEGTYFVAQLVPDNYKVVAKLTGFRTMERTGLVLQVGNTMTINLALPIGGIEENVTVTGQSPLVDATSARVGGNIGTDPRLNRRHARVWQVQLVGRCQLSAEQRRSGAEQREVPDRSHAGQWAVSRPRAA